MADSAFHKKSGTLTIGQIAALTRCEVKGDDGAMARVMQDVAALAEAGPGDVSFLDNIKYRDALPRSRAGACFLRPDMALLVPSGTLALLTPSPYKAYALTAQAFYPAEMPAQAARIAPGAHVDPMAKLSEGVTVDTGAIICAGALLGAHAWVEAGAYIGPNVQIGAHSRIGVNASVSHAVLGDHVRLYPGARIGQDGFGFAIDPSGHVKVPQLGRVVIEDHVEIGANTTIDRGAGPDTVIGQGTWIDNLVQIGHNVKIGRGCIIVSQVGISGSTVIDDYVAVGGQVGIAGHLHIGKGARIAAKSGIMRDIPPGQEHMGYPAVPMRQFMRQVAALNRLIKKEKTT